MNKFINLFITFIIIPVVIFLISYLHIYPQFRGEFTQYLGSIEVSYISMAHFILDSSGSNSWQPFWYLGYPMYLIYLPLVPYAEVLGKILFNSSPSHTYRFLTALSYCLSPVFLYLFVYFISKKRIAAVFSAMFYAVAPSIMAFLFTDIANDRFAKTFIDPRRFTILIRWGEGPHLVALMFLPVAALFYYRFIKGGHLSNLIMASLFIGLTSLTNAIAVSGLAVLLLGITIELSMHVQKKIVSFFGRLFIIILTTFGFISFWYNLSFIKTFYGEEGGTLTYWKGIFPWGFIAIVIGFSIYVYLLKKTAKKIILFPAALTWFLILFAFVYIYYSSGEDRIELVPQVLRLNTEVDMALAVALGLVLSYFLDKIWIKNILFKSIGVFLTVLVFSLLIIRSYVLADTLPKYAYSIEETNKNLEQSSEYKTAKNIESMMGNGERVFAPGNYGFFLNYFTKVPQLRGALYQSSIHPWPDHIYYQVTNGNNAIITLDWLKIANISYLIYTTGGSGEPFKDYKVPKDKFDKVLKVEKEEKGDIYYKVPLVDSSLAKVVSSKILGLTTPINAIDEKPIKEYISLIEAKPGKAKLTMLDKQTYQVEGEVGEGESVLIQVAYHKGWKAKNKQGKNLPVSSDPFDFIIVSPVETGHTSFTLTHGKIADQYLGYILTGLTVFGIIFSKFRKKNTIQAI